MEHYRSFSMGYQVGDFVGDYRVVGIVGSGGMGAVYKVEHSITKRIEAMKVLASARAADPDQAQRFLREIQVQARLHHANIAEVYNAFRSGDDFVMIMEFVEGESLQSLLEKGRIALPTGLDYACQALEALGYAHAQGVVHRDITPANMIITGDGTVKLTDFGLAKTVTDLRLTQSGSVLGCPWYMSPEQVNGPPILDPRSDLYSLGAVLYELATGCKLFDLDTAFSIMLAHMELPPQSPIERDPCLPPELSDIILRALAKNPDERFQSAERFREALKQFREASELGAEMATVAQEPPQQEEPAPIRRAARVRIDLRPALAWLSGMASQMGSMRQWLAGIGSAAAVATLLAGAWTYASLRVGAPAEPRGIVLKIPAAPAPAAAIPEPPAAEPALPAIPEPEVIAPTQAVQEAAAPPAPVRRHRRFTNHPVARPAVAVRMPEPPVLPEHAVAWTVTEPAHFRTASPRGEAAPVVDAKPVIEQPKAAAVEAAAVHEDDFADTLAAATPPAETPVDAAPRRKPGRFRRALGKIMLFHRDESKP